MNNIKRVTLVRPANNGWICSTDHLGETALVSHKVVEHNGMDRGDSLISSVVPHHSAPRVDYYCVWAHPEVPGTLDLHVCEEALQELEEDGGAILAGDLGQEVGDILYHAGLVGKFVYFDKNSPTDTATDVWYTVNRKGVDIFEVDE